MDPLLASALFGYSPSPSRFDEAVDESGAVRPIWRNLVATLAELGGAEIEQRRRQADRLIAASGASYLVHDETDASRPWRLDPVPVVLTADEWRPLAEAIAERAVLLDAVLADLFGPRTLLPRVVPPEAALGSPRYQWPVSTNQPSPSRWLTVYAADLVRTADGRWKVLRDLTDAPSGAGYALLNRSVLSRLFPDEHRKLGVLRLTDFFMALRAALAALAPEDRPDSRTVVLSSGLGHPSYFEHTYLAEQLGYNLAEGGDLTVRHGRVLLRSLGGLEPVDVLLRRIEDDLADPLELGDGESGGVPGLLHAARAGGVGLANALGSGAAGELALHPFLPAASRQLLGRALRLESLDTLWCGDDEQRMEVLSELDSMVVHESATGERGHTVFADQLSDAERHALVARIKTEPWRHVAQRKVEFATTPMLTDGAVVPGTVVLRVQAVLGPQGTVVLPGGLGRVLDPTIPVVTQSSGVAKDVWIVDGRGSASRERVRLEPRMPQVDLRASLPTRSAEALFWLGRHAERAEAVARLSRAVAVRSEQDPALLEPGSGWLEWAAAGLRAARGQAAADGPDTVGPHTVGPDTDGPDAHRPESGPAVELLAGELQAALTGPGGLIEQTQHVRRTASSVREFLSSTTWEVLESLEIDSDRPAESLDRVVVALSALSGLAMESTVRGPSWRLLDLGRRLERAFVVLGAVESMLAAPRAALDLAARYEVVLTAHESLVAYRRRYRSDARGEAVLDLLVADDANPRALAFQLDRMAEHLVALPGAGARSRLEDLLDASARTVMRAAWHDAESDDAAGRVPGDRLASVDRLVLDARGPLLDLADAFVSRWFADPASARRMGRSS